MVKRWAILDTVVTVKFWHLVDEMLQAVINLENLNGPLSILANSSDVTDEAVDDFISTLLGPTGDDLQAEQCESSDDYGVSEHEQVNEI